MQHTERPPDHKDDWPQYPDHRLLTAKYFCPGTGTPMPARDHLWPKRCRQLFQCPESFYDSSIRGYSSTRNDELSRVSRVVSDRPSRSRQAITLLPRSSPKHRTLHCLFEIIGKVATRSQEGNKKE
ncbi:hypothetical protein MAP00_004769 [Monascus purpureus]|nr:hypothetical protein MAP00_004769 [Monascus purpureus]